MQRAIVSITVIFAVAIAHTHQTYAQRRLDESPINYRQTDADNPIEKLASQIASGETRLQYENGTGYLRSILKELEIPVSSQSLVFSKTSLQSGRISPQNPRAFYFNDDVYVGWIRGSSLMEVATADPKLGAVFYSVQMSPRGASVRREHHRCLVCHEKTTDSGKVPMHTITSVMARETGQVNLLLAEYKTDHTSPLSERWGGWYVTGNSGQAEHMGNAFLEGETLVPMDPHQFNSLDGVIRTADWPTPHSDIVALMVLEHQVEMHNRLTRADYAVRRAAFQQDEGKIDDEAYRAILDQSAEEILEYLLFCDETKLTSPIVSSNQFADEFSKRGPFDSQGRSLREFDLQSRMFRFPCSYVIYSEQFKRLEAPLLSEVLRKLDGVLSGADQRPKFDHLSSETRRDIQTILKETKAF
ncbi:hypothetical protein LOC67_14910 [Stieleria sp. JC731]|uniref:hypothetical protein n=1 Tax=Pirellulaceae TaxID=2691357 RepID=UPI001E47C96D|nr:hypothetical protein [Stieleria sp. JC731]MCC9601849.1 hypothetical protein [Stieleria sp. JC731]